MNGDAELSLIGKKAQMPNVGGWEWVVLAAPIVIGIPVLVVVLVVKAARKSSRRAVAVYDQVFAGDLVTYQLAPGAPSYEVIVSEASRRGYHLAGQSPVGLLTFYRQPLS